LAGVLLVFIVWRWLRRRFGLGVSDKAESARLTELEQQYIEHCRLGHYSSAGDLLYQWLCRQLKILDHQSIELKRHDNSMRRWLASMNARHALKLFDHLMIVAHGDSLGSVKDHLKGLSNDPDKNMKSLETLPKEINRILNNTNIPSIDQQREFRLN
jgi:hypothetical protein